MRHYRQPRSKNIQRKSLNSNRKSNPTRSEQFNNLIVKTNLTRRKQRLKIEIDLATANSDY
jgi:hypothetical protein